MLVRSCTFLWAEPLPCGQVGIQTQRPFYPPFTHSQYVLQQESAATLTALWGRTKQRSCLPFELGSWNFWDPSRKFHLERFLKRDFWPVKSEEHHKCCISVLLLHHFILLDICAKLKQGISLTSCSQEWDTTRSYRHKQAWCHHSIAAHRLIRWRFLHQSPNRTSSLSTPWMWVIATIRVVAVNHTNQLDSHKAAPSNRYNKHPYILPFPPLPAHLPLPRLLTSSRLFHYRQYPLTCSRERRKKRHFSQLTWPKQGANRCCATHESGWRSLFTWSSMSRMSRVTTMLTAFPRLESWNSLATWPPGKQEKTSLKNSWHTSGAHYTRAETTLEIVTGENPHISTIVMAGKAHTSIDKVV